MDARYRPDGTHLSGEGSLRLAHDWLEAEILRLYRESSGARADAAAAPTPGTARAVDRSASR